MYSFDVTLTDQLEVQTLQKFVYKVVAHTAPQLVNTLSDVSLFEQGDAAQINLANVFNSMSGAELQFTASSSNEGVVKASTKGLATHS